VQPEVVLQPWVFIDGHDKPQFQVERQKHAVSQIRACEMSTTLRAPCTVVLACGEADFDNNLEFEARQGPS
jgi:hypothetical protein